MFGDITEVFGLYELSNEGTVLYSRPRGEDGLRQATTEVLGQDLFRDIFRCQNNEDLRRHFRRFISSDRPVDTFHFDCLYDRRVVRTKIFMTRAHETVDDGAGQIVIMDIRCADH